MVGMRNESGRLTVSGREQIFCLLFSEISFFFRFESRSKGWQWYHLDVVWNGVLISVALKNMADKYWCRGNHMADMLCCWKSIATCHPYLCMTVTWTLTIFAFSKYFWISFSGTIVPPIKHPVHWNLFGVFSVLFEMMLCVRNWRWLSNVPHFQDIQKKAHKERWC